MKVCRMDVEVIIKVVALPYYARSQDELIP